MPDWGIEDMNAWVATTFFAGTDTTTHAITNAIYLLAQSSELQNALRVGGAERVEQFTEEVLRLYPSAHFTRRKANEDFKLGGIEIKKDDLMLMVNAAANRDTSRYKSPHKVDMDRDGLRNHLAFSIGPRTCSGAALARGEIQESIARVLDRLPNLRLDPHAEEPRLHGFLFRSYQPLHVVFGAFA
jgi:cytochrome P450